MWYRGREFEESAWGKSSIAFGPKGENVNGPLASMVDEDGLLAKLAGWFLAVASTRVSVDKLVWGINATNGASGATIGGSSSSGIEC